MVKEGANGLIRTVDPTVAIFSLTFIVSSGRTGHIIGSRLAVTWRPIAITENKHTSNTF